MATSTEAVYSDIDASFLEHPIRREISILTDVDAVVMSVRNLVQTKFYEAPFQPKKGCAA